MRGQQAAPEQQVVSTMQARTEELNNFKASMDQQVKDIQLDTSRRLEAAVRQQRASDARLQKVEQSLYSKVEELTRTFEERVNQWAKDARSRVEFAQDMSTSW